MKQFLKWTGFILFAVIIGLALSVAYIAGARAQSRVAVVQRAITQAPPPAAFSGPWGYGDWGGYGQTGVYSPTQSLPYIGYGAGMMGRGMGSGMMGAYGSGHMGGLPGRLRTAIWGGGSKSGQPTKSGGWPARSIAWPKAWPRPMPSDRI